MRTIQPEDFEGYNVPEHTQDALIRYVNYGLLPGGFLTAVLTNDLFGAVSRADHLNIQALPEIVKFIYNEVPAPAVGSTASMEAWRQAILESQESEQ